MPGTQPGQVTLEGPGRCLNCHADYNHSVEPGFNWKGSMMAQASRDFLFWSCMTVAAQDSIWAVDTPNATDICERCHFPIGWVEGRSDPTNASLMRGDDYDGVNCDFCHNLYDPFFEDALAGSREGNDWLDYWDETNNSDTPSSAYALETYQEDSILAQDVLLLSGQPFFENNQPKYSTYMVNGGGQYFVSPNGQKRSSYADAAARHQMLYSRYHKSKYFCSTCHDISNPVLANLGLPGPADQSGGADLITEQYPSWRYFHVERTFSEFMLSDYGQQGGAPGIGPFAPQEFDTSYPNNNIAKCQDCHMRDVVGQGCDKNGVPVRPDQSVEHPNSGLPLHDMTGGNAWVSYVLASAMPGADNPDQTNYDLLNQGPSVLTLDMTAGRSADPAAILAGVNRSLQQLQLAAAINNLTHDPSTGALSFQVQNQTGHKLISGFPEGRRMFVNIKATYPDGSTYEINPYDYAAGTLKGLPYNYQSGFGLPLPQPLDSSVEVYVDELVYEAHTSSYLTGEEKTFHFALATDRYKDNRIPPRGFRLGDPDDDDLDDAYGRLSQPRSGGADDPDMYTTAEYAGGYDQVDLTIPSGAEYVEVNLCYQTTSREYVEFLRDEINGNPDNITLPTTPGEAGPGDPNNYIIQTDAFFAQLRAWGDSLWQLWTHNMNVPGAAPIVMTQATWGSGGDCTPPDPPALVQAVAGDKQITLTWAEVPADPAVDGYRLYYDQAGKAQLVADISVPPFNTHTDTGLTNEQEYCYKVSAYYAPDCESIFSDIVCASPTNQGQTTDPAGVTVIETGFYSGKGKTKTWNPSFTFAPGDTVVIRATVYDMINNVPLSNATVDIVVGGPETVTLTSGPSDADGIAEATWQTQKPNRKGQGGTAPGAYTASTTDVTASGYHWDSVTTNSTFEVR
jgi:hypothetical protein